MKFLSGCVIKNGKFSTTKRVVFFLCLFGAFILAAPGASAQSSASISGLVFNDLNVNRVLNISEPYLAGWQINLLQNKRIIQTVSSASDGSYVFFGLTAGDYEVEAIVPKTWAMVGARTIPVSLQSEQNFSLNLPFYQVIGSRSGYAPMMQISNFSVVPISATEARIIWFTNYAAVGQVVFGLDSKTGINLANGDAAFGYGNSSAVDFGAKTYHEIVLSNLQPDTIYHYRIVSLPDPRQWRGAAYVLSDEFVFKTANNGDLSANNQENSAAGFVSSSGPVNSPAVSLVKVSPARAGKILAVEITPEELAQIEAKEDLKNSAAPNQPDISPLVNSCTTYIWILFILNLLAVFGLANRFNRDSGKNYCEDVKKIWWMMTIFAVVPTIIGYPDCWLTVWLLLILIISLACLGLIKTKGSGGTGGKKENKDFMIAPEEIDSSVGKKNISDSEPVIAKFE